MNELCFCVHLFLFLSFWIWSQAFLSRICKFQGRIGVWLPEQLLSFTKASVLNRALRIWCATRCCLHKLFVWCKKKCLLSEEHNWTPWWRLKCLFNVLLLMAWITLSSINSHFFYHVVYHVSYCHLISSPEKLVLLWITLGFTKERRAPHFILCRIIWCWSYCSATLPLQYKDLQGAMENWWKEPLITNKSSGEGANYK